MNKPLIAASILSIALSGCFKSEEAPAQAPAPSAEQVEMEPSAQNAMEQASDMPVEAISAAMDSAPAEPAAMETEMSMEEKAAEEEKPTGY